MLSFDNSELLEDLVPEARPTLIDPRVALMMSHPTRIRAMGVLLERTASPREIAELLEEPVNNVTYHLDQLRKCGCIELAETRPARGGRVVEHVYRLTRRPIFENDVWEQFGEKEKTDVTNAIMRLASDDIAEAVAGGTFYDPDDNHLSRSLMSLDPEGWEEVNALLDRSLDDLFAIQNRVNDRQRTKDDDTTMLHTRVHMIHFRSPRPKERG